MEELRLVEWSVLSSQVLDEENRCLEVLISFIFHHFLNFFNN